MCDQLQKEPLSKSLRNRPFEHEQFMEILFPDVVGSGGAPKRITKPRRKGFEPMQDSDDLDGPGSNVMDLLSPGNSSMLLPTQTPIHPPTVPSNGTVRPASTMQNRQSIASSSALTPPDDEPHATNGHSRKRQGQADIALGQRGKRRRTANNNYIDLTHSAQLLNIDPSMQNDNILPNNFHQGGRQSNDADYAPGVPAGMSSGQLTHDVIMAIGDAARNFSKAGFPSNANRWTEHAMEIFFRDFSEEDPDLQLKIGEKVLCDTNKATMFCMMPEPLRQHWVKKLREVHNRLDVALSSTMNSNQAAAMNGSNGMMNGGGMAGMMQMSGSINGGGMGRNGSQVG